MALPTPTVAAATTRYAKFAVTKWVFCPTIANINAPTSAEMTAGVEWSGQVAAQSGFNVVSATIDTPDAGTTFTPKIGGRTSSDDSSLTFYMSSTSADARTTFTRNTSGFWCICYEGIVTSAKMDVFPSKVTAQTKSSDIEGAATLEVHFAITSQPAENVTVPIA